MEQYPEINSSPLSQRLHSNGKSVEVEIYEGDPNKWILEVVDQYGNSTIWNDQFSSDQAALGEVKKTNREEGIESLIGPPSSVN